MTGISRRRFLQTGIAAGVTINVSLMPPGADARLVETPPRPGSGWLTADGRPRYRLDALAKVTGAKTFSCDYRARDLDGWPPSQSHAFLIRTTQANRTFEGVDLTRLGNDLKPDRMVMHEDLVADSVLVPAVADQGFYGDVFLVPRGETPRLLGQPVALLIYHDFARFRAAKQRIRFDQSIVRYGKQTPYNHPPHYGAARYIRIDGGSPDAEDRYSSYKDAVIMGTFSGDDVVWPAASGSNPTARGMQAAQDVEREIAAAGESAVVLKRSYISQSIDPSAMEADNGIVWYDAARRVLHMMVATQAPYAVAQVAAQLVSEFYISAAGGRS